MARTNTPHATSVEQALRQEIVRLRSRLTTLKRTTTTAIQQASPASILDPIEGQLLINISDKHRLYWYSNGLWRSVCDCEAALADILITGRTIGSSWPNLYKLTAEGELTLVAEGNDDDDGYSQAFWLPGRTKILAATRAGFEDSWHEIDVASLARTTLGPVQHDGTIWFDPTTGIPRWGIRRNLTFPTWSVAKRDLDSGATTTLWTSTGVFPSGWTQSGLFPVVNRAGTKFFTGASNAPTSSTTWRYYTINVDGTGLSGILLTQADVFNTTNVIPQFSHDDTRVSFVSKTGGSLLQGVSVLNLSSLAKFTVYAVPGDAFGGIIFSKWSPDDSMIAVREAKMNGEYYIVIVNSDGSGIRQTIGPFPTTFINQWAWSDDSTQLIVGGQELKLWVADVAAGTFTEIYDGSTEFDQFGNLLMWHPEVYG